jgi:hypothetical protein
MIRRLGYGLGLGIGITDLGLELERLGAIDFCANATSCRYDLLREL